MNKYLIFSFLFFSLNVFSQDQAEFAQRFNQAKQLFEKGKYALAKEAFAPLIAAADANRYQEYAYYYCGLSDFYSGKYKDAQLFLNTLLQKSPDWNRKEDVYYLLANIAFENKEDAKALTELKKIQSQIFIEDVKNLKRFYIQKKNIAELKAIQKSFSDDIAVAELLFYKLKKQDKPPKDDLILSKQLAKQFNFSEKQPEPDAITLLPNRQANAEKSIKKESYNLAVLFPFGVESLDPNRSVRGNQLVLDMYEGMKIARSDLDKQGIKINLKAFEVGKDANPMLELVNNPDFEEMDLMVGPLYPASNQVAVAFANERGVTLINPISSNAKILENNPSAFLLHPSLETRSKKTAEFAAANFPENPVIILTGMTDEDSTYAYSYQKFIQEKGFSVLVLKELGTAEASQLASLLAGRTEKNTSHIFISTTNAKVVSTFLNVLEKNSLRIPVLTPSDWFKFEGGFERFEQRNVHFILPDYMDGQREPVRNFKQAYLRKTNLVPSAYACYGYELTMFFGRTLYENGTRFQKALHTQNGKKGWLFAGHDYTQANDNQYVPVFKFENSDFILLNPIEE